MWRNFRPLGQTLVLKLVCTIIISGIAMTGAAQICQGSLGDPIVNITFGAGANPGAPLPAATTNYSYVATDCPRDGEYAVRNKTEYCWDTLWNSVTDHTGDANGYFMLVNASFAPGQFYLDTVKNLCPGSNYEFAAWLVNLSKPIVCWGATQYVVPNITFRIERTDGTLLQTYNTGNIPATSPTQWKQYGFYFTTPAGVTDVVLRMVNNAPGGCGNDVGLDDITFRACGPQVMASISGSGTTIDTLCGGTAKTYDIQSTISAGYTNPVYQWQRSFNGSAWNNIPGETGTTLNVDFVASENPGTHSFRLLVAEAGNINSVTCRVASQPVNIFVTPVQSIVASNNSPVCEGGTIQLSSTGSSITWRGPNGFSQSGSEVNISNAQQIHAGDYIATMQSNGCNWFDTTSVMLSQKPNVTVNIDSATICEGDSVQLTASGASSYQWTPVKGLTNSAQPNVTASPTSSTIYSVIGSDGNQCNDTATVSIVVSKKPTANAGSDIAILKGTTVHLNGSVTGENVSYRWTPEYAMLGSQTLSPSVSPDRDTSYILEVISDAGCGSDIDTVRVTIFKEIQIPNAFSPNRDGKNDLWNIAGLNSYPKAELVVFDRYGREIMRSSNYKPWDGTKNGQPLPTATYYFVIDLRNGSPKITGYVYLAR
jgi:gliding motility-associated-like protein